MCRMSRVLRVRETMNYFWEGLGRASWCWCHMKLFTQPLVCPRACARCWGNSGEQDRCSPCPHGA